MSANSNRKQQTTQNLQHTTTTMDFNSLTEMLFSHLDLVMYLNTGSIFTLSCTSQHLHSRVKYHIEKHFVFPLSTSHNFEVYSPTTVLMTDIEEFENWTEVKKKYKSHNKITHMYYGKIFDFTTHQADLQEPFQHISFKYVPQTTPQPNSSALF